MRSDRLRTLCLAVAGCLVLSLSSCGDGGDSFGADSLLELDRGVRLLEDGHLDQAFDVFEDVIRNDPRNAEAYARRGFIHLARGNIAHGLGDVNRALEIDPDFALAHNYKGVAFDQTGIQDQAILEFTRAIELSPGLLDAYINRGRVFLEMGDGESALADFDKALSFEPENVELLMIRAQVHLIIGDVSRAEADLERILSLTDDERMTTAARQLLSNIR